MVNAQEWLDREYPKENRTEITELDIRGKNLEGVLDLSDFSSLETLWCSSNQLTNLNLSNCGKLNELDCKDNPNLTNLDLNNCRKLKSLTLYKGYLNTELDLSKFPRLKEDKIN
jgi:hypothetical protein